MTQCHKVMTQCHAVPKCNSEQNLWPGAACGNLKRQGYIQADELNWNGLKQYLEDAGNQKSQIDLKQAKHHLKPAFWAWVLVITGSKPKCKQQGQVPPEKLMNNDGQWVSSVGHMSKPKMSGLCHTVARSFLKQICKQGATNRLIRGITMGCHS